MENIEPQSCKSTAFARSTGAHNQWHDLICVPLLPPPADSNFKQVTFIDEQKIRSELSENKFDFSIYNMNRNNLERPISKFRSQLNKIQCVLQPKNDDLSEYCKGDKQLKIYLVVNNKTTGFKKQRKRNIITKCPHKTRTYFAKGLCQVCYYQNKKLEKQML